MADVLVDADRLAFLVVDEVQLRQPDQHCLAVPQFELRLDARADHLLRRDAIGLLGPWPHELDAAARHDESLVAVRAQAGEQLDHRLVHHLRDRALRDGILRGRNPVLDDLLELVGRHAGVRRHHDLEQRLVASGECALEIALQHRRIRLLRLPLGMLRRQGLDAVEREQTLHVHRLLGPQRAVVVERCDALVRRDVVGTRLVGGLADELNDRLFRRPVGPRREVVVTRVRRGTREQSETEHRGQPECPTIERTRQSQHANLPAK